MPTEPTTLQNSADLPIVTIASKNYLAHVRTLAQSYLEHHPNGKVFLCLVDHVDGYFNPADEPFTLILAEDLGIPNWPYFSFKYNIVELNTAVKPFVLKKLFDTYQYDKLVYFDPDIVLYTPLHELNALLDTYGVVLTPHILSPIGPINDTRVPSEFGILMAGMYNLGFIALSRRTNLDVLLLWWQERLYDYCINDPQRGFFVDQRWMDFAPSLFDNVFIWRNPGCNVAHWNMFQRPIENDGLRPTVEGEPLQFMHFSRFNVERATELFNITRFKLADLAATTQALYADYRERLLANGYTQVKDWPYAYGKFDNGETIIKEIRSWYRRLDARGQRWPNPFQAGADSFFQFFRRRQRLAQVAKFFLGEKHYIRLRKRILSLD